MDSWQGYCSRDFKGRNLSSIKIMARSSGTHHTFLEVLHGYKNGFQVLAQDKNGLKYEVI